MYIIMLNKIYMITILLSKTVNSVYSVLLADIFFNAKL